MRIAYQGKDGCRDLRCRRMGLVDGVCAGWHCAFCDEPCGSQGHLPCVKKALAEHEDGES